MAAKPPVWHDGTGAGGRVSGEIRCEIETLTPLLVGWERRRIDDTEEAWPVPFTSFGGDQVEVRFGEVGRTIKTKSVLCPLRAPWGDRPVLLPGDSIKGLLRHELGALLGAPMERVAERSYSYRPNSLFPNEPNPRLIPRLARVPGDAVVMAPLDPDDPKSQRVRVTRVIEWLAHFATSTPMPDDCDIPVLMPQTRKAVRAAIRVELALRAQDIPRAVHGTVAFFESALWDHLGPHLLPHPEAKRRLYRVDPPPDANLIRESSEDRGKPFESVEGADGARWYRVFDDDVCGIRLAKHYLKQEPLERLGQAVSRVRELRNDVAHNEPTPRLMAEARSRMTEASLWSTEGRFLSTPLVQRVLRDLGEPNPDRLCTDLISTIRSRLLEPLS
jgi:hypothetical protein